MSALNDVVSLNRARNKDLKVNQEAAEELAQLQLAVDAAQKESIRFEKIRGYAAETMTDFLNGNIRRGTARAKRWLTLYQCSGRAADDHDPHDDPQEAAA